LPQRSSNNISTREIGDDAALADLLGGEVDERNIGPYEELNWDGQKIRSVGSELRDAQGVPIAVLCINLNISLFESVKAALALSLSPAS
jgi:predicted transcriptional regulator YheO